jgi:hypothetical protein
VHDRRDVDRADVGVLAPAVGDVDAGRGDLEAGEERVCERARTAGEGEDGAVVVGVDVDVEEPRARGLEGLADRVDDGLVAALGDVRDRKQRRHGG